MTARTSLIGAIKINNVLFSSHLQIGDSGYVTPEAKVFAVQRKVQYFEGKEGNLNDYLIYRAELPHLPEEDTVTFTRDNPCPFLSVGVMQVASVSVASIVQLGSLRQYHADSRTKHIRQLTTLFER